MGFLRVHHFWIMLFTACLLATNAAISYAQDCQLQNTFLPPSEYVIQPSHFGANRGGRLHAGVDLYYPIGTKISAPDGCEPRIWSGDKSVIWKSDPDGYGQYMFYDCQLGDVPVTIRYAHINQYVTATAQIEQGRTGIEDGSIKDHYHVEVLLSEAPGRGTPVDPECVFGLDKTTGGRYAVEDNCDACPTSPGPVNFCADSSAVSKLIDHSRRCYKGNSKSNPAGKTVPPDRLRGLANQGTPAETSGPGDNAPTIIHDGPHNYTEPGDDEGFQGDVDALYPPLEEDPPIEPPPPRVPGTPGGTANLTPPPTGDASDVPLTSCGTDTWTAMVNQAVMQTRREDIMNKRFITKADSVLQYSCFAQDVLAIANTGVYFSGSEAWADRDIPNPDATDHPTEGNNRDPETIKIYDKETRETTYGINHEDRYFVNYLDRALLFDSLTLSVDSAYRSYINGHFTHDAPTEGDPNSGPPLCKTMASIWQAAKCKNFDDPTVFYTFEDLTTMDPRDFPATMRCGGP